MGKSHFLPRMFSHCGQVLKGILRQLRVIGQRHPLFCCFYCRLSFMLYQTDKADVVLSPLSRLRWQRMFLLFFFRQCLCPFSFSSRSLCYISQKRNTNYKKLLLSLHLSKRRIYHQTTFRHLFYALPHLTRFHSSHLETEKKRPDTVSLMIKLNLLHKRPGSILHFLTARWIFTRSLSLLFTLIVINLTLGHSENEAGKKTQTATNITVR